MRRRLPLLAALVTAGVFAAVALVSGALAGFDANGNYVSIAGTDLSTPHPVSNTGANLDCSTSGNPAEVGFDPASGGVLWHFILNQTDATSGLLRVDFATAGLTVPDVPNFPSNANVVHWYVITPTADTLLNASTDADGGRLNLSHVCYAQKASPRITTLASGAGKTGDSLFDTATLTGGFAPPSGTPGTVTFKLYGPNDGACSTVIYTDTVNVTWAANGTGSAQSTNGGLPAGGNVALAAGTYQWVASYSGNDQNNAAGPTACNDPAEASAITAAAPTLTTEIHLEPSDTAIASPFEVALGSSVHDSANASGPAALGIPTGDVDFTFYKGACGDNSNLLFTDADVLLVNGVAHPSDSSGALGAGQYHFQAHYDSDNEGRWSDSDSLCEPLTVNKAQLTIVTQIHNAAHGPVGDAVSVPLGSVVHDTATVSGAVAGFPIGDISFTLNGNAVTKEDPAEGGFSASTVDSDPLGAGSYTYKGFVDGNANYLGGNSGDEPLTVDKAQLTIVTQIHNAAHGPVGDAVSVPLGSVVHDTATVSGAVAGFPIGDISFTLNGNAVTKEDPAEGGFSASTVDSDPLGAGSYTYKGFVDGNANYLGGNSGDEPLTVDKAQLTIVTAIHNTSHNDITNTNVPVGSVVHDTAAVTGAVAGFDPTGAISFTLNSNPVANANPAEAGFAASTVDSDPLAAGSYVYKANVVGDDNYIGDDSPDEPLTVRTLGKTMGYWGNTNGQAALPPNPGVTLGTVSATTCSIVVNTKAISKVILPSTLNGVSILTNCTTSASRDSGINTGSLNTLLAQTLAISFNILYINGYPGQTVGGLGCTADGIAALSPLTNASTVQNVRDRANYLIANAKSGLPTVTQGQIGAMNTLLGCLNREV